MKVAFPPRLVPKYSNLLRRAFHDIFTTIALFESNSTTINYGNKPPPHNYTAPPQNPPITFPGNPLILRQHQSALQLLAPIPYLLLASYAFPLAPIPYLLLASYAFPLAPVLLYTPRLCQHATHPTWRRRPIKTTVTCMWTFTKSDVQDMDVDLFGVEYVGGWGE
ncbi:predicted protein [Plenodomus lingam JN3]|uniref:Uncharacterized protein n=1 Tax=Leptosphaeria maculans (strain JN3 / isolate v23.1.3 / race Av1-4-5-6-7-8) TaxID=985895 RepID=M1ZJJ3_LEPMJ|nr:predicted protein [Plenodomus lingam JN3]